MIEKKSRLLFKPYSIDVQTAHKEGVVTYKEDGIAILKIPNGEQYIVPLANQYDLTQATIFGLNERLTMAATSPVLDEEGTTLRDKFNDEWEKYSDALGDSDNFSFDYGYYVYYAERNDLVRFASPFWHKIVAVASSSKLITNSEKDLSWQEIRDIFSKTVIGVGGCSVGSSIIHTLMMDVRPDVIKIADKSVYKMENINRVRMSYWDMVKNNSQKDNLMDLGLINKANTVAQQLYTMDPFLDVYVYNEGVDTENIKQFFDGDDNEPKIDMVVDEVDDPRTKILLRLEARKRRIPLLMFTDIGSSVQVDILRFDLDEDTPLALGVEDDILIQNMESLYDEGMDRKRFFSFVDLLIGKEYRQGELADIIDEKCEIPTATMIPQLGSTVATTSGVAAEIIARLRLGLEFPSRMIFNKVTFYTHISD